MQRRSFPQLSRLALYSDNLIAKKIGCGGAGRHSSGMANVGESSGTSLDSRPRRQSGLIRRGGALALFVAMGLVGYKAVDDLVIYDRCSSKAVEKASQSPRLKEFLGDEIHRGPWHWCQASLAVGHEGHSASCSFPVSGSRGTGSLHLKALRLEDRTDGILARVVDRGEWDVLMLEARIPGSSEDNPARSPQTINLMQENDDLKPGDLLDGDGSQCMSSSLHEV